MTEHRIDILPRPNRRHGPEPIAYHGKAIGKSKEPILTAARWLLENNAAFPEDTIETYRPNGVLSMSGIVGQLAKLTVEERDGGNPSLRLRRWRPFSAGTLAPETSKTGSEAV
jgi:hypothetical protein